MEVTKSWQPKRRQPTDSRGATFVPAISAVQTDVSFRSQGSPRGQLCDLLQREAHEASARLLCEELTRHLRNPGEAQSPPADPGCPGELGRQGEGETVTQTSRDKSRDELSLGGLGRRLSPTRGSAEGA